MLKKQKIKIQIMSIFGSVLFEHKSIDNTLKETVEKAVENGANLYGANLNRASLDGANLNGVNLNGAKNLNPIYVSDLYSLKLLPKNTILNYWKYLKNGKSPIQDNKIEYKVGKTYTEKDFDTDETKNCGKGLNVGTLMWCLKYDNSPDIELIEVQFKVSDIVAIPYFTDGKFRVKQLKVLRKISRQKAEKLLKDITKL